MEFSVPGTNVYTEAQPLTSITGACLQEYNLMHYTLQITITELIGLWLLLILIIINGETGGALAVLVNIIEGILSLGSIIISLVGIATTAFSSDPEGLLTCTHLHYVAWWIYTGFSLIGLAFVCSVFGCVICGMAGMTAAASGREPSVTVAVQDAGEYEKMPDETSLA